MTTRREALGALVCLPLALRAKCLDMHGESAGRPGRGFACALGEGADAGLLPVPRRQGEHLALALAGTPRPPASALDRLVGAADPVWVELSPKEREGVDDGPLAERIRAAAGLTLIEGDVLDWLVTLWPARRSSAVLLAIAECAYTGGRVVGRGSTAFLVAAGGVVRGATREATGESRLRATNPREDGEPRLCAGLGLCGDLFVDTQTRANDSALRLLSCLIEAHENEAILLGPRSILCCDLELRSWSALGNAPLLYMDLSRSRRLAESIEGARLSVMAAGDGWSHRERALSSSGEQCEFAEASSQVRDGDGLTHEALTSAPATRRSWNDARARVELAQTFNSRACSGPSAASARAHALAWSVALARGRWGEIGS